MSGRSRARPTAYASSVWDTCVREIFGASVAWGGQGTHLAAVAEDVDSPHSVADPQVGARGGGRVALHIGAARYRVGNAIQTVVTAKLLCPNLGTTSTASVAVDCPVRLGLCSGGVTAVRRRPCLRERALSRCHGDGEGCLVFPTRGEEVKEAVYFACSRKIGHGVPVLILRQHRRAPRAQLAPEGKGDGGGNGQRLIPLSQRTHGLAKAAQVSRAQPQLCRLLLHLLRRGPRAHAALALLPLQVKLVSAF